MPNRSPWIAYVGPFPFPWGQAGSRRMCGIARSLADAGYRVVVGSGSACPASETSLGEGEHHDSIAYLGLGECPDNNASIIGKSMRIFWSWGLRTVAWLEAQQTPPSHVVVYGGSAQYMLRLLPWCNRRGVPLIADVVEWYDPRQLSGGILGPFNLSAKLALRFLYPRCDGIIAVSRLLADYYAASELPVVRIPPTTDVTGNALSTRHLVAEDGRLTLVYAGTPGKKDLIGNVLAAVSRVDPQGNRLRLLVMGPTVEQLKDIAGVSRLPPCVENLGRIDQASVAAYIRSADFSVLLREPLRFANAGFPTKFVESMSNGTPVIANLTSDLGLYLHDGVEGLVCTGHSAEALVAALRRAMALSRRELNAMRIAARHQAECSFDFRVYVGALSEFLEGIERKALCAPLGGCA